MTELLQEAIAQIQKLPEERQDAIAARLLDELADDCALKNRDDRNTRPIWEQFAEFTDSLPEDAIADLPPDGAANVDRYLYQDRKSKS